MSSDTSIADRPEMTPRARALAVLAAAGSICLLGGAFAFQALGYAPCQMCLWQRWPHLIAGLIGGLILVMPQRILFICGAMAAAATAGLGFFHSGVEQKWWDGPASCSGGGTGLSGLSGDQLLATDTIDKLVMCDEISWAFAGLSMPTWNAVLSVCLMCLWILALRIR